MRFCVYLQLSTSYSPFNVFFNTVAPADVFSLQTILMLICSLAMFLAVVLGARGTAGLGPRAGAVPIADPATADPDPGPTPDLGPVPAPKPTHHAEASPNRLPGPVQGPSPSLAPGAILPDPTKDPNPDPDQEANPNLQWILEPLLNPEI